LVYQGGVVTRYSTWAACERVVKGQSNVKYKKAKSAQEEREILKSWGLSPDTPIQ
jgi:ribonuclease HI